MRAPSAIRVAVALALCLGGCRSAGHASLTAARLTPVLGGKASLPEGLLTGAGAGILSEHGVGIVANNSGQVIANNGGQIVGKTKYGLLASGQKPAIGFKVQLVDASGATVYDETTTDEEGKFAFVHVPDGHHLLARLVLPGDAGRLVALVANGQHQDVALEGVGTHVIGYVLDQYVHADQAALDKLDAAEAAEAVARAEAALAAVAGGKLDAGSLASTDVVKTVGVWRSLSQDFDHQLVAIQQRLGVVN